MQIFDGQTDKAALTGIAAEAAQLLRSSAFSELANRFGYAVALGREPAAAIREDLASALSQLNVAGVGSDDSVSVKYFQTNGSGVFAVIECIVSAAGGGELLLELVVTSQGADKYVTLEQIGVAA